MIEHPKRKELADIIIRCSLGDKKKYTITQILDDIITLFERKDEGCPHYFPLTKNGYLPCEFCGKKKE